MQLSHVANTQQALGLQNRQQEFHVNFLSVCKKSLFPAFL